MNNQTKRESESTGVEQSRRGVLRSIGAASAIGGFTKLSRGSPKPVVGTTYDTLTHQVGGPVVGQVARSSNNLDGSLRMAGFNIPLDELQLLEQKSNGANRYTAVLTDQQFLKNEKGLKINLTDHKNHLAGYITRSGRGFGKLGFIIVNEGAPVAGNTKSFMNPDERWKQAPIDFSIPDKGVPTDSALSNLMKELPTTADVAGGDN